MAAVLDQEAAKALLSDDHFSVKPAPAKAGGTLIEAWTGIKSFRPQRRQRRAAGAGPQWPAPAKAGGERDFHGEKRSNKTHASTTDPDARPYRKSLPLRKQGGLASLPSWPIWVMF